MKTVCVDARLFRISGIGTYLKNLLGVLQEAPLRWLVLVHKEQLASFPWKDGLEPIVVDSPVYSVREQVELFFKIPKVDLFWSPHYNIPLFPIRAKKRLVTIHDVLHLAFAHLLRPLEKAYAKILLESAVRLSDRIITGSQFSKGEIEAYTSAKAEKLEVVPSGVDWAIFNSSMKGSDVLEKYQIKTPFLLFVGYLKKHKNVDGLVEAFDLLHRGGWKDLSLVVVGPQQGVVRRENRLMEKIYQEFPHLRECLRFVGDVPDLDLPHFYRAAEVFVFPSLYEGFGFPPLEAMACGCPTVVSDRGAMMEVCGEGAAYVDPLDPSQMAEVLEEVLKNSEMRGQLVQRGLARSSEFSWKKCAERHFEIIERLMA